MVRIEGLEPPRHRHWFLRPAQLPISPYPQYCAPGRTRTLNARIKSPALFQLSYKRMVWMRGFEPPTPWSQARCSTKLSHIQMLTHCCATRLLSYRHSNVSITCTSLNCQFASAPQYHHGNQDLARPEGLEPSSTVLETAILPLNYVRSYQQKRHPFGCRLTLWADVLLLLHKTVTWLHPHGQAELRGLTLSSCCAINISHGGSFVAY